jgi:oligoribonuclease NrnB/cAMP/cGMP phosphodiesterase (DHH superfamily)
LFIKKEFILKNISRNSKILSISHNDLDGTVAQIILGQVFNNTTYMNTSFYKIDSVLESIEYDNYDFIILTDIHPDRKENLYLSDKIILLDHHESAIDYNNPSKMHYVISGKCAAHLTKNFIEKYFNIKLEYLDDITRLTDIYDMWRKENKDFNYAKKLNDLMFYKYRPKKFRELFFDGKTYFTEEENNWLKERDKEFEKLYENLNVYELENLNGCVTESKEFINEICDKLMDEEKYKIVFVRNPWHGRVSIRSKYEKLDTGGLLKKLGFGGGHRESSGFFASDINDFQEKIIKLEKVFVDHI